MQTSIPTTGGGKIRPILHPTNKRQILTPAEKQRRHRILSALVFELRCPEFVQSTDLMAFGYIQFFTPNVKNSSYFGMMNDGELWKRGICEIPGAIYNALICENLSKKFGDLSIAGIFKKVAFNNADYWRIDIDENLSRRGIFEPVRDSRNLIYGLRVYRYADDKHPFILKSRRANAITR